MLSMVILDRRQVFPLERLTSTGATFYVKIYCSCCFWHPFDFLRNSSWLLKLLIWFLDSKVYHNSFFLISSSVHFFSYLSFVSSLYIRDVLAVPISPAEEQHGKYLHDVLFPQNFSGLFSWEDVSVWKGEGKDLRGLFQSLWRNGKCWFNNRNCAFGHIVSPVCRFLLWILVVSLDMLEWSCISGKVDGSKIWSEDCVHVPVLTCMWRLPVQALPWLLL